MCNDATVIIENNEVLATIVIDNNCEQFTIIASGLGTPGLSAYDIAVANGFIGTEAQWIASLQVSKTSDLINDGADGVHPFITLEDIPSVTVSDATTTTKGIIKLAGDLSGTADLPTVPNKVDKVTGYSLTKNDLTDLLKAAYDSAVTWISTNGATLISHLTNYSNPHQTTASQVGAYTTTETDTLLNGKVPYTGATANVDLGEFQLKAGQLEFDQTPTGTFSTGMVRWNDVDGTTERRLKGNNVTLQDGQEILKRVVNKTGADLLESAYKVVRIRTVIDGGSQGQRSAIVLAQADTNINSNATLGVVTENITNNQEGFITLLGEVREINTTGSLQGETWADGDQLYLSAFVAGGLTKVVPASPYYSIPVATIDYAHAVHGKFSVNVGNRLALDTTLSGDNDTAPSVTAVRTYVDTKDGLVVHKAGVETITGEKTFQGLTTFEGTTQTGSSANGILNLLQTWNTTGLVHAIDLIITNTASAASSNFLRFRVSGKNAFRFQASTSTLLLGNGSNNIGISSALATNGNGSIDGTVLRLVSQPGASSGYAFWWSCVGNRTATSGESGMFNIKESFAPITGTGTHNTIYISPIINQTGTANGITRGLHIDPIITSAVDFRAIEATRGSIVLPYQAAITTYPIKTSDYLVDFTTGTFTATLPTAVGCVGKTYVLKNSGTGVITIATTSSQTIDGMTTNSLIQYATITVVSNGANWIKI